MKKNDLRREVLSVIKTVILLSLVPVLIRKRAGGRSDSVKLLLVIWVDSFCGFNIFYDSVTFCNCPRLFRTC